MENTLEIQSYDSIIPNSTWSKETDPVEHPESKKLYPATEIIQLTRFKTPSESEIIRLIQQVTKKIDLSSRHLRYKGPKMEIPIPGFLRQLSKKDLKNIIEGEKEIIEHFKKHSNIILSPRRTYVQCLSASLPNEVLKGVEEYLTEDSEEKYEELIRDGPRRRYLTVTLDANGNFPKKEELDFLFEKGVRDCYLFKTDIPYNQYSEMMEQFLSLSEALNPKRNIKKIKDFTDKVRGICTYKTVKATSRCILGRRGMNQIRNGLRDMIERIGEFGEDDSENGEGFDFPPGFIFFD